MIFILYLYRKKVRDSCSLFKCEQNDEKSRHIEKNIFKNVTTHFKRTETVKRWEG